MKKGIMVLAAVAIFFGLFFNASAIRVRITQEEISNIGYKIYKNECGLKAENLTHWNKGEKFASMGIGHFLWFPAGSRQVYTSSFPKLLTFFKQNRIKLPDWLENNYQACPWSNIYSFNRDNNSYKMRSLRKLLQSTMYQQTMFIIYQFNSSIPRIIQAAKANGTEEHVKTQLYRVARSYMGMYVLIDYTNFKGTGTNRAGGQWGLLQVLENMNGTQTGRIACYDFAKSAAYVLRRRVNNSTNKAQEEKWYPGWMKRLETYYM
jgi:hypothetical protein